jgi:hypothetical protein
MTRKEYKRFKLFLKENEPHNQGWYGWVILQKDYADKKQISTYYSLKNLNLNYIFKEHHHKYIQKIHLWTTNSSGVTKYF